MRIQIIGDPNFVEARVVISVHAGEFDFANALLMVSAEQARNAEMLKELTRNAELELRMRAGH